MCSRLTLDTVRVGVQAKALADRCTEKDTSYESPMKLEALPDEYLGMWSKALGPLDGAGGQATKAAAELGLKLPDPNPFIAEDLSLRPQPEGGVPPLPQLVPADGLSPVARIYHRQDDTFLQPKAGVVFIIYSPFPMSSVRDCLCTEVWCKIVSEALNEYAYDAAVAGVRYSLSSSAGAVRLELGGFNDKFNVLLDAVTSKMRSMTEVPENLFSLVKEAYMDDLRNAAFRSAPYAQCTMRFNELVMKGSVFPSYQKVKELETLKREDLSGMPGKLFERSHVEVLSVGNLLPENVQELSRALVDTLELSQPLAELPERAEAVLPDGSTLWSLPSTDEDSPNHAVFMRIQVKDTVETDMMMQLLASVLSSKFFDELRTQQQLGYIVGMQAGASSKFNYLIAVVQTEFPPDYTRSKIDEFINEKFAFVLNDLEQDEFDRCRSGLLSELKVKPKNLGEEMGRYAGALSSRTFDFDRLNRSISFMEGDACSLEALRAFLKDALSGAPRMYSQVRKVLDKADKELPEGASVPEDPDGLRKWTTHVETIEEFKKTAEWIPFNNKVDS
jgi:insulysin